MHTHSSSVQCVQFVVEFQCIREKQTRLLNCTAASASQNPCFSACASLLGEEGRRRRRQLPLPSIIGIKGADAQTLSAMHGCMHACIHSATAWMATPSIHSRTYRNSNMLHAPCSMFHQPPFLSLSSRRPYQLFHVCCCTFHPPNQLIRTCVRTYVPCVLSVYHVVWTRT